MGLTCRDFQQQKPKEPPCEGLPLRIQLASLATWLQSCFCRASRITSCHQGVLTRDAINLQRGERGSKAGGTPWAATPPRKWPLRMPFLTGLGVMDEAIYGVLESNELGQPNTVVTMTVILKNRNKANCSALDCVDCSLKKVLLQRVLITWPCFPHYCTYYYSYLFTFFFFFCPWTGSISNIGALSCSRLHL